MSALSWTSAVTDPLELRFFVLGLVASTLSLLAGAGVGFGVVLRRESYLGQGIGQAMIAGVACGSLIGAGLVASAFIGAILAVALISLISRARMLGSDAAIAIVSASALSLGVMVISSNREKSVNVTNILFGNVLGVDSTDVLLLFGAAILSWGFTLTFGRRLTLLACAPAVARAHKAVSFSLEAGRVLVVAVVIAASVQVVGVALVVVALVFPAVASSLLTRTLGTGHAAAAAISVCTAVTGMYISYWADIASGPAIVLAAASFLLCAAVLSRLVRR